MKNILFTLLLLFTAPLGLLAQTPESIYGTFKLMDGGWAKPQVRQFVVNNAAPILGRINDIMAEPSAPESSFSNSDLFCFKADAYYFAIDADVAALVAKAPVALRDAALQRLLVVADTDRYQAAKTGNFIYCGSDLSAYKNALRYHYSDFLDDGVPFFGDDRTGFLVNTTPVPYNGYLRYLAFLNGQLAGKTRADALTFVNGEITKFTNLTKANTPNLLLVDYYSILNDLRRKQMEITAMPATDSIRRPKPKK